MANYEAVMNIRLPRSMKKRIQDRADECNMKVSEFMRHLILLAEQIKVYPKRIEK